MTVILKIANWDDLYEDHRTRALKRLRWVPVPCKFDGDGYTELVVGHENGPAHYAAWMAFLLSASRCEPRGTLMRSTGEPHTTATIAATTKIPKALLDESLPRLIGIGWIVSEPAKIRHKSGGRPAVVAHKSGDCPAPSCARAPASIPFSSLPFFLGKGVQGERGELPEALESEDFREQLENWIAYKAERREGYKPAGFRSMLTHAANMAKRHGLPAVVEAFIRAMANGWVGWDQNSSFGKGQNGKQRTIPYGNGTEANRDLAPDAAGGKRI